MTMEQRKRRFSTYTVGMDKKPVGEMSRGELIETTRIFCPDASVKTLREFVVTLIEGHTDDDTLRNFIMNIIDDCTGGNEKAEWSNVSIVPRSLPL